MTISLTTAAKAIVSAPLEVTSRPVVSVQWNHFRNKKILAQYHRFSLPNSRTIENVRISFRSSPSDMVEFQMLCDDATTPLKVDDVSRIFSHLVINGETEKITAEAQVLIQDILVVLREQYETNVQT